MDFNKIIGDFTGYNPGTGEIKGTPIARGIAQLISPQEQANGAQPTQQSNIDQYNAQEEAKRQDALKKEALGMADEYDDPSKVQSEIFNRFKNQRLGDLYKDQQSTQRRLAKRGMGYGGVAAGAMERLKGESDLDLQTGKYKIKSGAEGKAQQIRDDVLNNALKLRQTKQDMMDEVYNSALTDYMNRKSAMTNFGRMVGGIAGTIYGGPAGGYAGAEAGGAVMS